MFGRYQPSCRPPTLGSSSSSAFRLWRDKSRTIRSFGIRIGAYILPTCRKKLSWSSLLVDTARALSFLCRAWSRTEASRLLVRRMAHCSHGIDYTEPPTRVLRVHALDTIEKDLTSVVEDFHREGFARRFERSQLYCPSQGTRNGIAD